jgi:hypothetical protein
LYLFLSYWDSTNQDDPHHALGAIGKPSMSKGAPRWFHHV